MTSIVISISELKFTNRTNAELSLVLEPEGDVIQIPYGKTCQIVPEQKASAVLDCEIEIGSESEVTVYLAIAKHVYVDRERVR